MPDVDVVSAELAARLAAGPWTPEPPTSPATEVAAFALSLSGKRRQARRGGWRRLIARFALAACLALASVATACDKPDATADEIAEEISQLPEVSASEASVVAQPRGSPAQFNDLVLADAGSDQQPWAVFLPRSGGDAPILMDRVGANATQVGGVYQVAAQPVKVGTRDGVSQFLDPLVPAESTGSADASQARAQLQRWQEDERVLAATRAIVGQPTVLDAAYNAEAAATAGGTHTYMNGVVLRVEADKPVVEVIDKALLESGKPTRAEDMVYVAIRPQEQSLYSPGQVVNLRDVVMDAQKTDVEGQPTTVYVANAALDGARVETTGASVDLQSLLGQRLQRVDQDLAEQASAQGAAPQPQATTTPGSVVVQQPVVVNRGGSFVSDYLMFMWLTNSGFYSRGPNVIINNPPSSANRSGDIFYSAPPAAGGSSPSTTQSAQSDARNTALQASRSAVSGQGAGTGGGVAATSKSAADASARVSAATSKAATVAGGVSTASSGKSITSVPRSTSSTTASRSAGTVSAGSRGTAISGSSSSSGSTSIGRSSSGSSGGFGGKGVGSSSSS